MNNKTRGCYFSYKQQCTTEATSTYITAAACSGSPTPEGPQSTMSAPGVTSDHACVAELETRKSAGRAAKYWRAQEHPLAAFPLLLAPNRGLRLSLGLHPTHNEMSRNLKEPAINLWLT
jgi:hypothetical protein